MGAGQNPELNVSIAILIFVKPNFAAQRNEQEKFDDLKNHRNISSHSLTVSTSGSVSTSQSKQSLGRLKDCSRAKTLESYVNCIYAWHMTNFSKKLRFPRASLRAHYKTLFSSSKITMFPKIFKGLLCDFFSIKTHQERPIVPITGEKIFPARYLKRIEREISQSNIKTNVLLWDLMQCKSLAAEVDKSFVKETLLKHRETVTKITTTAPELLADFQKFVRPWAKTVAASQLEGEFPNSHSCYETSRGKGGVRSQFIVNDSKFSQPSSPRLDPTTLLISGNAGAGKSLLQTLIARNISKRMKHSDQSETFYCRNASVKHWDGYKNQPLCIIDDFLQQKVKVASEVVEHSEFIAVNSTVDYVLPMASLDDKGKTFTSPLIIYSSNKSLQNCVTCLNATLSDEAAIRRRFSFYLSQRGEKWTLQRNSVIREDNGGSEKVYSDLSTVFTSSNIIDMVEPVTTLLLNEWNRKGVFYNNVISDSQLLPVGSGQTLECLVRDDHNKVKVTPIIEPLKVRTITIGTAKNFLLKSLQKSMLNGLRPYPAFKPCFTPDYDEWVHEKSLLEEKTWLSGDYSSATDGLHSDLFSAGIEVLVEELKLANHPGWLTDLVLRESSPHICEYPMDIPECLQTNGQLMGSLLSFPYLCLANAFTVAKSEGHLDLSQINNALIHGDDLLWRTDSDSISKWKSFCPTIGLGLSMGKNYISSDWGSIDSQLFVNGKRMSTGKYTCYKGTNAQMVETLLKKGLSKSVVVNLSRDFLKQTPRSIDVSTEFGGLGISGSPVSQRACIINNLKQRKSVGSIAKLPNGYIVTMPSLFLPKSFDRQIDLEMPAARQDVLFSSIRKYEKSHIVEPMESLTPFTSRSVFIPLRNKSLELLLDNLKEHYCPMTKVNE